MRDRDAFAAELTSATARSRDERGQTLVELLVVMTVLAIVSDADLDELRHQLAEPRSTSLAVVKMPAIARAARSSDAARHPLRSRDHAARAANDYGGFTLTLPENPGQCPGSRLRELGRLGRPVVHGSRTRAARRDSGSSASTRRMCRVQRRIRGHVRDRLHRQPPAAGRPTPRHSPSRRAGRATSGRPPTPAPPGACRRSRSTSTSTSSPVDHPNGRLRADRPDRCTQRRPLLSQTRGSACSGLYRGLRLWAAGASEAVTRPD